MKTKLVSIIGLALLLTACSTFYNTVISMTAVVDSGMKQWAQLSKAGKTSQDIDNKVIAAHDKYREACAIAQASLIAYKNGADQNKYIQALATARVAASGLFDLILPLLPKTKADSLSADLMKANSL